MKKILAFLVILGIVSWVSIIFYKAYQPKPLLLQGEIEAQSYHISSKLPGRISEVFVRKGDVVKPNDLIFTINSPEVRARMQQAKAAKVAAGAKNKEAQYGARKQQVKAAEDQWHKAEAASELMKKTYMRVNRLFTDGVIAEQKRDETYTQWQAAKYTENAAKQLFLMTQEGAREEIKTAAQAQENVYEGKVAEVQAFVEETRQYTYHGGEVTQVLIHEGELAPTGFPVVSVQDMNNTWAVFHIREDLIKHFKKGHVVKIRIPAIDETKLFEFKVSHVSVMGDYASWRAAEAGKGFDLKSFEVEMRPLKTISDLRVGMSTLIEL